MTPEWNLQASRERRKLTTPAKVSSNEDLIQGWLRYNQTRLAPDTTLPRYLRHIRIHAGYLQGLLFTDVSREDLWFYVEDYLNGPRGCANFCAGTFRRKEAFCHTGLDLAGCGMQCSGREAVQLKTVRSHLDAIVSMYQYLTRRGFIASNIAKDVAEEWWEENRHLERNRLYRRFTTAEVEQLVGRTRRPNCRIAFALYALTGIRAEEALRLKRTAAWLNLEEGWVVLPERPHQKRRGETKLWLTEELVDEMEVYLEWWEATVQRDAKGEPVTDQLLLTARGEPWLNYSTLHDAWQIQCKRTGILTGDEDELNTLTPHDLRHWLTTELVKAKAPDYYVALYRGDKRAVIADHYTHLTDETKRTEFLRYAPRPTF